MTTTIAPPLALGVKAFCKSAGVSRSLAYDLMKRGDLKTVKIGGRRLIPMTEAVRLTQGEAA